MQNMENCSVERSERAVEVNRQIIRCVQYENARVIGLVQVQRPWRFPPKINASQQRRRLTEPVRVKHVFRIHIAMFTLADQSISEVWPHVESVVAVEPRKLELTALSEMPHVIDDYCSVRSLLVLARINGVIRGWCVNRYQSWLESGTVIADAIYREFMVAEVEHLRNVALILLAMLQSVEVAVAEGDLGSHPGSVQWIGRAPTRNKIEITIVAC